MNFFQILADVITRFGFLQGIILFIKLKLKQFNRLKVPGVKYPITMRRGSSDHSVFLQVFVKEEYAFNYKHTINTIIDAGANAGYATIYFANLFNEAKIISIEPEKENFELLQKNTSLISNITLLYAAIWYKSTSIQVLNNGGGQWNYSVEEAKTGILKSFTIQEIMKMYDIKTIDIFKIDIEGSEREIFQENVEDWLPVTKYLIIETHDRMKKDCTKAVFSALNKYNFTCYLNGENFIFVNEDI